MRLFLANLSRRVYKLKAARTRPRFAWRCWTRAERTSSRREELSFGNIRPCVGQQCASREHGIVAPIAAIALAVLLFEWWYSIGGRCDGLPILIFDLRSVKLQLCGGAVSRDWRIREHGTEKAEHESRWETAEATRG